MTVTRFLCNIRFQRWASEGKSKTYIIRKQGTADIFKLYYMKTESNLKNSYLSMHSFLRRFSQPIPCFLIQIKSSSKKMFHIFLGKKIAVTTGVFELRTSYMQCCKASERRWGRYHYFESSAGGSKNICG